MAFNKKLTFEGLQYYHSKIKTLFSNVNKSISDETTRATTKENEIANNLSAEITRAKNSEALKAPLASPALTGTPTAPTASSGTNTTQIATTAFVQTAVSNHNSSTTSHSDIRDLISGLTTRLNALADSDDTTLDQLSEIVAYIKSNRTLIENVTTNKVNVADIIDNLTSTAKNKPLSAKQGKVLNDLISSLTSVVNTKIDTINGDTYIGTSKSGNTGTITHKDVTRSNTASTASPSHGGTFTAVKTVTSDAKGHVTGVDTETVTLPTYTALKNPNAISINGKSYDGSSAVDVGTIGAAYGGTGKTSLNDSANVLINSLSTGDSTPSDTDYYVAQYVGGGTTTTTYHRRPMSALWSYIKSKLATVATSGSYNDLSNKPTIPTVGNGTITIKQAGTSKGTFTMNQSGNTTIELTDNNTTYGVATSSTPGLVKSGTDITVDSSGNVSVNDDSHNHIISNVDGLQSALDGKASSSHTHTKSQISDFPTSLPASDVYAWAKASSKPSYTASEVGAISTSENTTLNATIILGKNDEYGIYPNTNNYCQLGRSNLKFWKIYTTNGYFDKINDGTPITSSNITSQSVNYATSAGNADTLDGNHASDFATSSHTHSYAGSSSAGGSATSAVKLDSSAGSATQPVYFSGGKPVACTYTLGKSVPSNAVFTDTDTWRGITTSLTSTSTNISLAASAGKSLQDQITTLNSSLALGMNFIPKTISNCTATTLNGFDMGAYRLNTELMKKMGDKPKTYTGGAVYLIRGFAYSNDENFSILIMPKDKKFYIDYRYGTKWNGWQEVSVSSTVTTS